MSKLNRETLLSFLTRPPPAIKTMIPHGIKTLILNAILPKDTVILSYPKSGRTWLRVLIGKAIAERYGYRDQDIFKALRMTHQHGLDRIRFKHDDLPPQRATRYWEQDTDKSKYRGCKVIFLTRDIRDVLVSSFHASRKRDQVFQGTISDFIRSDVLGVKRILTFYNIWYKNRHVPEVFLHTSYEALHANPGAVLRRVLDTISARDIDDDIIERAITFASFDNMRRLEQESFFGVGTVMRPKIPGDPESHKVRRGQIGGYCDELSDADLAYIESAVQELGNPFE
jgi:hypothetical protein